MALELGVRHLVIPTAGNAGGALAAYAARAGLDCTVLMPADFAGKEITWHLTANNKSTKVPMGLSPLWEVEPYRDAAVGNTPPTVRLEAEGTEFQGPPTDIAATYEATVSEPLTLTSWANDDDVVDEYRRARVEYVALATL